MFENLRGGGTLPAAGSAPAVSRLARVEMRERKLRVRHVGPAARCRVCTRLFFEQRTGSGRSTETLCSAECALTALKQRERALVSSP